jgi:hypothetical protein
MPGTAIHAAEAEWSAVDVFYIGNVPAEEESGDDLFGVVAGGLQVGEGRAVLRETLEAGEGESGGPTVEDLVVGELIHEDPDDARLTRRCGAERRIGEGGLLGHLETQRLPGEFRQKDEHAEGGDGEEATGRIESLLPHPGPQTP